MLKHKKYLRILKYIPLLVVLYLFFTSIRIVVYSSEYSEQKSDVGIVLGAGTINGNLSPIFKERINHAIYLYQNKKIESIIVTGGLGEGQEKADSEVGKQYLLGMGIPEESIFVEKKSRFTIQNLAEAKVIMDSAGFESALLISDPLHMKRSMDLAEEMSINCKSSPTKTTMYRSFVPKTKSLIYETFFYSIGEIGGYN